MAPYSFSSLFRVKYNFLTLFRTLMCISLEKKSFKLTSLGFILLEKVQISGPGPFPWTSGSLFKFSQFLHVVSWFFNGRFSLFLL